MRGYCLALSALILQACGGTSDEADGSGGAASGGGSTGGQTDSGGAAASGGSEASGGSAESSGGTSTGGTASCPAVPLSRVLPIVGPFFMGPDPGPCSQASDDPLYEGTYTYDGDLAASSTVWDGETYTRDAEDRMLTYEAGGAPVSTYTYEASAFVEDSGGLLTRYELDSQGYVVRAIRTPEGQEPLVWQYQYEDCRLVRRTPPPDDPTYSERVYTYDEEGHIASFTETERTVSFDYSCWK